MHASADKAFAEFGGLKRLASIPPARCRVADFLLTLTSELTPNDVKRPFGENPNRLQFG
jgi:hypothetical protein